MLAARLVISFPGRSSLLPQRKVAANLQARSISSILIEDNSPRHHDIQRGKLVSSEFDKTIQITKSER
jgi:hypothetical protein